MARYLVVENDTKLFETIQDCLKSLDSGADIVHFDRLISYEIEINKLNESEKVVFCKFDLALISLHEVSLKEWKTKIEAVKKFIPTTAPILISTYENELITHKFLNQLPIYNAIFKPFDKLILKETLNLSLQIEKLASTKELKSQKASTFIGVLKEVELQSISELGFLTLSDASIPTMSISKYFSPIFSVGRKQSIWAQCLLSAPHPQKPGFYINKFQFYYPSKNLLNQIRKFIVVFKQNETSSAAWNLMAAASPQKFKMALIGLQNIENENYRKEINDHFKNIEVEFLDYTVASSWPKTLTHDLVLNVCDLEFDNFKDYFKPNTRYFWIPQKELKEDVLKEVAVNYLDIFNHPYDRSYFYKKLKTHVPELELLEAPYLLNISTHEKIKAANTVKVIDVNEVYINFNYSRELNFNSFREFIFLKDEDDTMIEVPAFCHFKDKAKNVEASDKNIYFHQFVFFGMTDHFLKEIRLWLMHNHVINNKKEN
jgi:hypothetical protein